MLSNLISILRTQFSLQDIRLIFQFYVSLSKITIIFVFILYVIFKFNLIKLSYNRDIVRCYIKLKFFLSKPLTQEEIDWYVDDIRPFNLRRVSPALSPAVLRTGGVPTKRQNIEMKPQSDEPLTKRSSITTPTKVPRDLETLYKNINEILYEARRQRSLPKKYAPSSFKNNDKKPHRRGSNTKMVSKQLASLTFEPQMDILSSLLPSLSINHTVDKDTANIIKDSMQALKEGISITHSLPIIDEFKKSINEFLQNESTQALGIMILQTTLKFIMAYAEVQDIYIRMSYIADFLSNLLIKDIQLKKIHLCYTTALTTFCEFVISNRRNAVNQTTVSINNQIFIEQSSNAFIEALTTPLIAFMYYSAFNSEYKGDYTKGVFKELFSISKNITSINTGVKWLFDTLDFIKRAFISMSYGESLSFGLFPELEDLVKDVDKNISDFRNGANYDYDKAQELYNLEQRIRTVHAQIPNDHAFNGYKTQVLELKRSLKPFIDKMARSNINNNGPRRETMAILLTGPPGVGKSVLLPALIGKIGTLILPDDKIDSFVKNRNDHIYSFDSRKDFHDGYHGQFFTAIDEFGAMRDSTGAPNTDFLMILKAVNIWAFNLDMAHLEDKGVTNFRSEVMLLTSNMTHIQCKSLEEPRAIGRRIKLAFLQVPKIKYSKCCSDNPNANLDADYWSRRLDVTKFPPGKSKLDFSFLEFHPYDVMSGKTLGSPINYTELVELVCSVYEENKHFGDSIIESHGFNIQETLKEREEYQRKTKERFSIQCDESIPLIDKYGESIANAWQTAKTACDKWLKKVDYNTYLITIGTVIPAMYTIMCLLAAPFGEQSTYAKSHQIMQSKASRRRVAKLAPQMCVANSNFNDIVNSVVRFNHYRVTTNHGVRGLFTFIKGRVGVMPQHFYSKWEELSEQYDDLTIIFEKVLSPESRFEIYWSDLRGHCNDLDEKSDITFVYVPTAHQHKDISKFLISEDMPALNCNIHGALVRFDDNLGGGSIMKIQTTPIQIVGEYKYTLWTNNRNYMYNIKTNIGECGALLFSADSTMKQVKLLGYHVAGDGHSAGLSFALFSEMFEENFKIVSREFVQNDLEVQNGLHAQMGGLPTRFNMTKTVAKMALPTKNNIVKSPLFEAWGSTPNAPTILYKVGDVDPWANARANYSGRECAIDLGLLDACTYAYNNSIHTRALHHDDPWRPRVFSTIEAIEGIPGEYKSIPRSTSPGYPYCLTTILPGKGDMFGITDEFQYTSHACKTLFAELEECESKIRNNIRPTFYYGDFLKAERRKKEKVVAGKNRLFSASPLTLLILVRKYFGDFTRWMQQNKISNGVAVGVNPFSIEWDVIAKTLQSVGNDMIFGDFAHYDASLSKAVMYKVLIVVEKFYKDATIEEVNARRVLFEDVVNSMHIASSDMLEDAIKLNSKYNGNVSNNNDKLKLMSVVYEWTSSNPSGNPLTTFVNSICNNIMIIYCACRIYYFDNGKINARYPSIMPDFDFVLSQIRIITFGDDNGISVGEVLKSHVTQEAMTIAMAQIGMEYTSEDKSSIHLTHRPLEECTFLKCHFRWHDGLRRYVAPQDLSMLDMPYWTKANSGDPESVQNTVQTLIDKLSLWGEDVFLTHVPKIVSESAKRMNYHPIRQDYKSCFQYMLTYEARFE